MPPDDILYHYQTLITGVLAIGVGVLTTALLWRQIRQTERQILEANESQEQQRLRKLRALRAGLPIALTRIHQYSNECIGVLLGILRMLPSGDEVVARATAAWPVTALPTYPADAFEVLQRTIEFAEAGDAEKLARAIAYSQIQYSRLSSLYARIYEGGDPDFVVTRSNVLGSVRDAVGMRLHSDAMYDYGRETELHIHQLGDAEKAAEALLMIRGGNAASQYVRENWPPDFPRRMSDV